MASHLNQVLSWQQSWALIFDSCHKLHPDSSVENSFFHWQALVFTTGRKGWPEVQNSLVEKCMTKSASKGSGEECSEMKSQVPSASMTLPSTGLLLNLAHHMLLDPLFRLLRPIASNLGLRHTWIKILRPCESGEKNSSQDPMTYLNGPFVLVWSITDSHKQRLHMPYLTFPYPLPFKQILRIAEGRKAVSTK